MNESLWTFVFEVANFLALAAVLAWLFFKPVRKALEDQQAKARSLEEAATQKLAEAERLRYDIQSRHDALNAELDTMRAKAQDAAKQESEQLLAEARAHIERERATLKRQALHIEQAQASKFAAAVATATHDTMKRFLQQIDGPQLDHALMQAACREMRELSNDSLGSVSVESATPLDQDQQQLINTSIGGTAQSVEFRVNPELKGGLRIASERGLIDASIEGLANFAEQSLAAEMESLIREEAESG